MKLHSILSLALYLVVPSSHGYVTRHLLQQCMMATSTTTLQAAVALEPEPEGGKELTAITSMPGCRVKEMKELSVKSNLGTPYQFWMTAEVDGTLIKEIRTQILKDASKKANFPGFRKVRRKQDTYIHARRMPAVFVRPTTTTTRTRRVDMFDAEYGPSLIVGL